MRFTKAMASRADHELVEIVTGPPEDWEPEAIEAAKAEIEKRGLRFERPAASAAEPSATVRVDEAPIHPRMKATAFFLGALLSVAGVVLGLVILASANEAQRRRGRKLIGWTVAGALLSILVFSGTRC